MTLDFWIGCIHDWYDISIEHIKCKVCWNCGKVKEK